MKIETKLEITATLLLGEYIGTLEGVCAWDISQELKLKLQTKIEELKKVKIISSKPDVSGSLPCLRERNGGKQCKALCEGCFQLYKKERGGGNDR